MKCKTTAPSKTKTIPQFTVKPVKNFKNLKEDFNHHEERFSLHEVSKLLGRKVIYLPEIGRMVTKETESYSSLKSICREYGYKMHKSCSKDFMFEFLEEVSFKLKLKTPDDEAVYTASDLKDLFRSEV